MSDSPKITDADLYQDIRELLLSACTTVRRAEYGKHVLPELAKRLSAEFGKGFSLPNLRNFRQFYLIFSMDEIRYSLRSELTWTHYRCLIRVENKAARTWYANEAASQNWSVLALDRQISTLYYERLLGSQKYDGVRDEAATKIASEAAANPRDFIRDPMCWSSWACSQMPDCMRRMSSKA